MNSNSYHEARMKALNWRKLPVHMKARYGRWKAASDVTWTPKFTVTVTHRRGRLLKEPFIYPFEFKMDAQDCMQWWSENGCVAEIKESR